LASIPEQITHYGQVIQIRQNLRGLTPHGLRHTHKILIKELGTPGKLTDERMGHEDGSVQPRYSHITAVMRGQLVPRRPDDAVAGARRALSPR
jgi:integrase